MCKSKQLVLITSLMIFGISSANSERASKIIENLTALKQCQHVIAPNYVLAQRSKLDSCIEKNSAEFSVMQREFRNFTNDTTTPELSNHIDQRNKIIAELYHEYDQEIFNDKATSALATLTTTLAATGIGYGISYGVGCGIGYVASVIISSFRK